MESQGGEMEENRVAEVPAVPRSERHPRDPSDRRAHRLCRLVPPDDQDRLEERGEPRAGLRPRRRRSRRACSTSDSWPRRGARRRPRPCRPRRWSSGWELPTRKPERPEKVRGLKPVSDPRTLHPPRGRGGMADALVSGTSGATRGGSSPLDRTDASPAKAGLACLWQPEHSRPMIFSL